MAWRIRRPCRFGGAGLGPDDPPPRGDLAGDGLGFEGCGNDIAQLVASFRACPGGGWSSSAAPGSASLTLAVQMVVELLTHRRDDEPVPVVFSLIEYDPVMASPQEWLVGRLRRDYPGLTEPLASALVQRGRILPVLDGLDEVPRGSGGRHPAGAERCGGWRRRVHPDQPSTGLSARTVRFGDVLTAAAVIAPLALTPAEACRYLRTQLAPGDRLLDPTRHTALVRGRHGAALRTLGSF